MATATLGTANTAATIANATVPTPHEQAAAALAAAQEDLQRQGEAMTAYE
jgi:hypothetical protein